jgi:hypothetical protein
MGSMKAINGGAVVGFELYSCIVDQYWDDKIALGTCGLVCRDWLRSSRRYLFHSVILCPKTGPPFVNLLQSPNCTIPQYVRVLSLRDGRGQFSREKVWVQKFIRRFKRLPSVVCLTIEDLKWSSMDLMARIALVGSFTHLNTLCLSHSAFETFDQVVDMICARPQLEELQLDDVSWNSTSIEPLTEIPLIDLSFSSTPCPSRLQTFHLGRCPKEDIIHWLLRRQSECLTIRSLALDALMPTEVASVAELLRVVGSSLKCLDLRMSRLDQCEGTCLLSLLRRFRNY